LEKGGAGEESFFLKNEGKFPNGQRKSALKHRLDCKKKKNVLHLEMGRLKKEKLHKKNLQSTANWTREKQGGG